MGILGGKYAGQALQAKVKKPPDRILIALIADHTNWEAMASSYALLLCLRQEQAEVGTTAYCLEAGDEIPPTVNVAILVLSNGSFLQPSFVTYLLKVADLNSKFIPIISEDGFRFPAKAMLDEIRDSASTKLRPYGVTADPDTIVRVISNIFKDIAVVFSPADYSSDAALLTVKAKAIIDRVTGPKIQRLTAAATSADLEKSTEKAVDRAASIKSNGNGSSRTEAHFLAY